MTAINDEYIIMPVANGFVLRPHQHDYAVIAGNRQTFVFESAENLVKFIDARFEPVGEIDK